MRTVSLVVRIFPLSATLLPAVASAQTITETVGLFNIFVGLMLTAAILFFVAGLVVWATRLGTYPTYRTEAIHIMEWGVVILFMLIVLLAVVHFFQNDPQMASYVLATLVFLAILWAILYIATRPKAEDEDEH
jgi:hypothetical protein